MATIESQQPSTAEFSAAQRSTGWTRKQMREFFGLSLLQIVMTLLLITFLIPAFWMFSSSLKSSTEIFQVPVVWIPDSPQWDNFVEIFQLPGLPFATFIWNTVKVVFFAVTGTVISSALVAYAFARLEWPGRDFSLGSWSPPS